MGFTLAVVRRTAAEHLAARLACAIVCLIVTASPLSAGRGDDPGLKPGDLAPEFALPGSDGRTHTLAEHRGVRPVVLAWFPKAFAKE
jgi:hypothetical protein